MRRPTLLPTCGCSLPAPSGAIPDTVVDPTKTEAGDWMIRVMLDLPYPMLASLEAKAGSHNVGELIRAALVTAGHGTGSDIVGVRSDRYATRNEQRERRGISAEISGTREGE